MASLEAENDARSPTPIFQSPEFAGRQGRERFAYRADRFAIATFSKNRHGRFRESDILRQPFETIVERCMAEGLVGAEGSARFVRRGFARDPQIARSDPAAQWTRARKGHAFFA